MTLSDTWFRRDLPVLEAIVSYFEQSGGALIPHLRDIVESSGFSIDEVSRAALNLDGTYILLKKVIAPPENWLVTRVSSDALVATGQWPSAESLSSQILNSLENEAKLEEDPVKQSRIRDAIKVLGEVVKGVGTNVLTQVITNSMR